MPRIFVRYKSRHSGCAWTMSVIAALCLCSAFDRAWGQGDLIFLGDPRTDSLPYDPLPIPQPAPPAQPSRKSSGSLKRVRPSAPSLQPTSPSTRQSTRQPANQSPRPTMPFTQSRSAEAISIQQRLDDLRQRMSDGEIAEKQKIRKIEDNIDRIKRLIAEKRKRAQNKPTPVVAPATPPEVASPNDAESTESLEAILGDMDVITEKSVDPMGLANNLFAIGELQLALKMYQEILASEEQELQPGNKVWVQFQIAGCYRRLGNSPKAETIYRAVAGNKVAPYWAERSRWWLTSMGTTARIKERDLKLVNTLSRLKELTNELSEDKAE